MPIISAAAIVEHMIAVVAATPLRRDPFPHLYFERIFPPDLYAVMLECLPPERCYRRDNAEKYARGEAAGRRLVTPLDRTADDLPSPAREIWTTVASALRATELRDALWTRFGVPPDASGHARPVLVRGEPGYAIEPHPDSRAKRLTRQCYLATDETREQLGTTLYRLQPFRPAVWLRRERPMQRAGHLPFRPNSAYAFAVRWNSFHGVEPVPEGAGVRDTLMNVFYRQP